MSLFRQFVRQCHHHNFLCGKSAAERRTFNQGIPGSNHLTPFSNIMQFSRPLDVAFTLNVYIEMQWKCGRE